MEMAVIKGIATDDVLMLASNMKIDSKTNISRLSRPRRKGEKTMKTATTKKPKMVTYEAFKNLNTMLDTMEKRPPNAVFIKKETLSSQRDETDARKSFTGTNTYADAMDIMKAGYKDPLEKMKKAILKIGQRDNYQRPRLQNDFVGFVPHVPNTVMNFL